MSTEWWVRQVINTDRENETKLSFLPSLIVLSQKAEIRWHPEPYDGIFTYLFVILITFKILFWRVNEKNISLNLSILACREKNIKHAECKITINKTWLHDFIIFFTQTLMSIYWVLFWFPSSDWKLIRTKR